MKAIDTNVLARYVMADDPIESPVATAIMAGPCYISDTVLMETAWLLGSRYRVERADLAATLADIVDLPTVTVSDADLVHWAIGRFAAGADLADMLHLVAGRDADAFATFESRLDQLAGPDAPITIETLR